MNWNEVFEPLRPIAESGVSEIILFIVLAFAILAFFGAPILLIGAIVLGKFRKK